MSIYDFTPKDSRGLDHPLAQYKGKVVLIVNVASKCGHTPQYEGLEKLYETYKDQGFVIVGFPCNQFGGQEPGTNDEIQEFCKLNYGVTFPVLAKIDVNGKNADPLYVYLKSEKSGIGGSAIKWNFTKFLIGRQGQVIERFSTQTEPEKLTDDIERAIAEPA